MQSKFQEPTFPEVVFWEGQELRRIEGCLNAYVTKDGNIWYLKPDGTFQPAIKTKMKTTRGSYLYARVIDSVSYIPSFKAIHQLVCRAFHGDPPNDGKRYEPNHINCDKHDNRAENLEWVTRSQNVQHAFDKGVCTVGIRIEARSILTGEIRQYNSLSSMAREWGIPREELRTVLACHRERPYQHEWIFSLDHESDKKINRYQSQDIIFKDYVTGQIVIVKDAAEASMLTGVRSSTIVNRTRRRIKGSLTLLSRYVFQLFHDQQPWPNYTVEEAQAAEILYRDKPKIRHGVTQKVKDYLTGEIYTEPSLKKAYHRCAKLRNKQEGIFASFYNDCKSKQQIKLNRGLLIMEDRDNLVWPVFTQEEILSSLTPRHKPVIATDIESNTTKRYESKAQLMDDLGVSDTAVNNHLGKGTFMKGRYRLTLETSNT